MQRLFLVAALTLSACADVPATETDIAAMSVAQLCREFYIYRNSFYPDRAESFLQAAISQGKFNEAEIRDIRSETIRRGMREDVAACAWGAPLQTNVTAGAWGVHKQLVLGDFGPYVYIENGRVTAWQTSH